MKGCKHRGRGAALQAVLWGAIALLGLGLLVACGGSSGGGGGGTVGVSAGEIEGLGSIIVNGVEFETGAAQVEIEGEAASAADLQEGMIVEVEGSFNADDSTGTATLVRSEDALEGPIAAISSSSALVKSFSIMGQAVIAEQGVTHFGSTVTFDTLADNTVVQVSGLPDESGVILASRIEKKADDLASFIAAGNLLEITGDVTTVASATAFTIGTLNIDTTSAVVDQQNGTLDVGALVEVKGNAFDAGTTTLTATSVKVGIDGLGQANVAKAEVEGFVDSLTATTFTLNGQVVSFSGAVFRGGIPADLVEGVRVEAQGPIDAGGILQATKITFKESVRIEANIDLPSGSTLTLEGLPGITVTVDSTITEGAAAFATALTGNEVKVRARPSGTGGTTLMAVRYEDKGGPSNRSLLQGPVTSFDSATGTVTIMSTVVVDASTIQNDDYKDEDTIIGRDAFFAALTVGDIVKARLDLDTGSWDQIELED